MAVLLGLEVETGTPQLDIDAALRSLGYARIIEAPAKEETPTADDPGEGERPGVVSGSSE